MMYFTERLLLKNIIKCFLQTLIASPEMSPAPSQREDRVVLLSVLERIGSVINTANATMQYFFRMLPSPQLNLS